MEEKRLNKRSLLDSKVTLSFLPASDDSGRESFEVQITDVSVDGIGFRTDHQLMIGEVYAGRITLWTKETLDSFLKIVRCTAEPDGAYEYGAIFVGMNDNEQRRIRIYQAFEEYQKENGNS